jgi:hypothetical protein
MIVSNQPASLLDSILAAQSTREEMGVAVLKKAQDSAKQEGEAMVKMLEQASTSASSNGRLLDVFA